jgi:hypothetical protein
MRNTGEMPRMATEILPTNSADVVRVAPVVPAVRVASVVPEGPVESAVWAALVVPEDPVELAVRVALVVPEDPAELAVQVALVVSESLVARVVPEDPGVPAGLVVSESPAVPVALAVPVAVLERELVPVEAGLVQGHPRAQLAVVALRTKSVIAVHLHDLVRLLEAAEALAAVVAETTREPAAAEAAIAWEVADIVAAEAVVAVAVAAEVVAVAVAEDAAEAAEDAEDNELSISGRQMKTKTNIMTSSKISLGAFAILISCLLSLAVQAAPAAKTDAPPTSEPKQKEFDSPKQAADALIQVAANFDVAAAKEILGPDSADIIASEDPVQDKNRAEGFAAKAKEKNSIEIDKKDPNRAILLVGNDDFPLPIPIVKRKGKWLFDTKVGREEILNRRIGANELNAIQICRGFVEAQHEYAQDKHDGSKVNQYAQRIISSPGKQDGLAWQNADGTWGGPVGEEVAKALEQGYSERSQPYHGYYFKVLKGQGPAAPMGEMDFVVGGAMIGGFALAAAPAEYRVTGVQTFIVGPDGVVYEKDLGRDTLKTFQSMDRYNPDKTWKVTEDDVEDDSQD